VTHTSPRPGNRAIHRIATDALGEYLAAEALPNWLIEFMEQLPIAVVVVDNLGKPRYANRAAERITGVRIHPQARPGEFARVYAVRVAGTDDIYPEDRLPVNRALAGERTTVDDMELMRPGRRVRLRAWGTPLYDEGGAIAFAMVAFADITAEKLLETVFQEESRIIERGRIAEGIHDDVLQLLTAATLRIGTLRRAAEPSSAAAAEAIETMVHEAIVRLRTIIAGLKPRAYESRPLSETLGASLEPLASRGIAVAVEDHLVAAPPELVRLAVQRVCEEAIANIGKHARPSRVTVALENRDDGFLISIFDDGVGFTEDPVPEAGHLGLELMRERVSRLGGWLRVQSAPGHGTSITMWIPDSSSGPG
jgi:signal transduction histidine kinase